MSTTLFQATLDLARIVTDVVENVATAGSSTHLADASMTRSIPGTDYFAQGCMWFKSCSGTKLNGTTSVITSSSAASSYSNSYMFATISSTITAGDTYAATTGDWPRDTLRRAVSLALEELGIPDQEDTSLTTVADQQEYDLPSGVYNVKKLEYATSTSSPYDYREHRFWYELDGHLKLMPGYEFGMDSYKIRLTYNAVPSELTADSSTIPQMVHKDLLKWTAAVIALRWQFQRRGENDKVVMRQLQEAMAQKDIAMQKWGKLIQKTPRAHDHSIWATPINSVTDDSEPDHVRI